VHSKKTAIQENIVPINPMHVLLSDTLAPNFSKPSKHLTATPAYSRDPHFRLLPQLPFPVLTLKNEESLLMRGWVFISLAA
jgi:hypothetical protein